MTVEELIEALRRFEPSTRVVIAGFDESGYDDPKPPRIIKIVQIATEASHSGRYDQIEDARTIIGEPFDAVLIDFSVEF